MGVKLMDLGEDDRLVAIAKLAERSDEDGDADASPDDPQATLV